VPEAEKVIASMPKVAPEIFPVTTDAVSASFTRACQFLNIEDLHFHDLRHDGVSRLFEMGWNIPKVSAVSGFIESIVHGGLREAGGMYIRTKHEQRVKQPKVAPCKTHALSLTSSPKRHLVASAATIAARRSNLVARPDKIRSTADTLISEARVRPDFHSSLRRPTRI
jgi:hypothetical protein